MSDVCEMFGCTPREAMRQDMGLVNRIAEFRAARAAVATMNGGEQGAKQLAEHPSLGHLIAEMIAAQQETLG